MVVTEDLPYIRIVYGMKWKGFNNNNLFELVGHGLDYGKQYAEYVDINLSTRQVTIRQFDGVDIFVEVGDVLVRDSHGCIRLLRSV